jgi:hypothetical protein
MTDDEINEVASRLLHKHFEDLGFEYSTVESEQDFDGGPILRVRAYFTNGEAPTERLISALHEIRSELIRRGEERFVFLDSEFPHDQDELVDDDLE